MLDNPFVHYIARKLGVGHYKFVTYLSNHTGKKYSEIEKDSNSDYWMRSHEAKKYGIIDNILTKNKNE